MVQEIPTAEAIQTEIAEAQKAYEAAIKVAAKSRKAAEAAVGNVAFEDLAELFEQVKFDEAGVSRCKSALTVAEGKLEFEAVRERWNAQEALRTNITTAFDEVMTVFHNELVAAGVETITFTGGDETIVKFVGEGVVKPPSAGRTRKGSGNGNGTRVSHGAIRINDTGEEFRSINAAYNTLRSRTDESLAYAKPSPVNTASATRWLDGHGFSFTGIATA